MRARLISGSRRRGRGIAALDVFGEKAGLDVEHAAIGEPIIEEGMGDE